MNAPPFSQKQMIVALVGLICAATFLCLSPTLSNDYVNFDDTKYLVFNPAVKSLTKASVTSLFTTFSGEQYHYVPLTLLSYAVEFHFHDLSPRIYHADNLFLHVLNTALCFWMVFVLFRDVRLAAIVSLLFGIHPMHVQSVAWISERKDLLYSFFYLSGLVFYIKYVDAGKLRLIVLSFALFALSLLSKPMAVTFPLILMLVDLVRHRRVSVKMFLEKIPFFLGSIVIARITMLPKDFPVIEFEKGYTWFERFLIACYTFTQFVMKALYPQSLSAYYPLPERIDGHLPLPFLVAPFAALLILSLAYFLSKRSARMAFGALFFLASIALVLNFIPLGNILMADHYSYISYIGIFIILAELFFLILRHATLTVSFRKVLIVSAVLWVAVLGFKSYQRTFTWSNSETLWADVIDQFPDEAFAYYNLADYYVRQEQFGKAIKEYTAAIEADPHYFSAYNNRGNMYFLYGHNELAESDYLRAMTINPNWELPLANLARLYDSMGRHEEASHILKQLSDLP